MNLIKTLGFWLSTFAYTLLTGIFGYWIIILMLAFLTAQGFVNLHKLPDEIQQLDIRCDKDDAVCRGEKCDS